MEQSACIHGSFNSDCFIIDASKASIIRDPMEAKWPSYSMNYMLHAHIYSKKVYLSFKKADLLFLSAAEGSCTPSVC